MEPNRLRELLEKYRKGTASPEEKNEINEWHRKNVDRDLEFPESEADTFQYMLSKLNRDIRPQRRITLWPRFAAAVALLIASGLIIYYSHPKAGPGKQSLAQIHDIVPGGNKAILTLPNGNKISLTDAKNGALASQNGVIITKSANGMVTYKISGDPKHTSSAGDSGIGEYTTIETPAGGQYKVQLPDGSEVWLNAMSSIRFSLNLAREKQRIVELSGEAFFDVKHNEKMPFRVQARNTVTEDIGTQFDIEAYDDMSAVKTTLIQGAASVSAGTRRALLKPGQQARSGNELSVVSVNAENVIAWKNGFFHYEDETLENIMKDVSRWYDVKVVFEDESLKNEHYGAVTNRFANISSFLNLMQDMGTLDLQLNDRTLTVKRKITK